MEADQLKRYGVRVIAVLVLLGFIWFSRPLWHGFYEAFWLKTPMVTTLIAGGVALFLVGKYLDRNSDLLNDTGVDVAGILTALGVIVAVFGLLFGAFVEDVYSQEDKAQEVLERAEGLDHLPDTDHTRPRVLPLSVSERYATDSLQLPRYRTANADITFAADGTPQWSYPLSPDGFVNVFAAKQHGAMFVDMTQEEKDVRVVEDRFDCGVGMQITDSHTWRLLSEKYDATFEDPFVVESSGSLFIATPYVTYEHKVKFPGIYSVPQFGGVALMDTECNVKFLSPSEAESSPVLDGQIYYPYDLARWEVNSLELRHGALNAWFIHRDQIELASVPGDDNEQPFAVPTSDGVELFHAVEPWGDARGIYQVWMIDGQTGEVTFVEYDVQDALLGPNKAAQMVRKDNPRVDWDRFDVSEPVPATVNGKLFWQIKVVPGDSAGISFTAFVDAHNADVHVAEGTSEVVDFLRNGP